MKTMLTAVALTLTVVTGLAHAQNKPQATPQTAAVCAMTASELQLLADQALKGNMPADKRRELEQMRQSYNGFIRVMVVRYSNNPQYQAGIPDAARVVANDSLEGNLRVFDTCQNIFLR